MHLILVENETVLFIPTKEQISRALHSLDPKAEAEADENLKKAVHFLLNVAVPAVEPKVLRNREWVKNETTHVKFLGTSWVCEMATAVLLIDKFSDTGNLTYNLGLTDKSGRALETKNIPEKKRRKKMHTKTEEKQLQRSYYHLCMFFKKLQNSDKFEERMKAWDDICCGDRGRVSDENRVAARTNTVPSAFQELGQDDSEAVFQEFLKSSTFANIWDSVPSLSSSPAGSNSGRSTPSGQSTPRLITQPEQQHESDNSGRSIESFRREGVQVGQV